MKMSDKLGNKSRGVIRYCNFFITPPKGYVFALNTAPFLNHNTMGAVCVGCWLISTDKRIKKKKESMEIELETKELKKVGCE